MQRERWHQKYGLARRATNWLLHVGLWWRDISCGWANRKQTTYLYNDGYFNKCFKRLSLPSRLLRHGRTRAQHWKQANTRETNGRKKTKTDNDFISSLSFIQKLPQRFGEYTLNWKALCSSDTLHVFFLFFSHNMLYFSVISQCHFPFILPAIIKVLTVEPGFHLSVKRLFYKSSNKKTKKRELCLFPSGVWSRYSTLRCARFMLLIWVLLRLPQILLYLQVKRLAVYLLSVTLRH